MNELQIHEHARPFKECICGGRLNDYWSRQIDDYEAQLAQPYNDVNEDHKEILENYYRNFDNGFKMTMIGPDTCIDDLIEDFEEYNMGLIYSIADICMAQQCCECENYHHCWAKDFSFDEFMRKDVLTSHGQNVFYECFDDMFSDIFEQEYQCSEFWFILQAAREFGYALPLSAHWATELLSGSTRDFSLMFLARKTVVFNDCQVLLFPEFAMDFAEAGKADEPLLLTG